MRINQREAFVLNCQQCDKARSLRSSFLPRGYRHPPVAHCMSGVPSHRIPVAEPFSHVDSSFPPVGSQLVIRNPVIEIRNTPKSAYELGFDMAGDLRRPVLRSTCVSRECTSGVKLTQKSRGNTWPQDAPIMVCTRETPCILGKHEFRLFFISDWFQQPFLPAYL